MAEILKPNYTYLWSSGGAVVAPSPGKIQMGWTAEVPPYQWENWSQNRQDQAIAHIMQHGLAVWDSATEYQANKSYVTGSDGNIYKCLITSTGVDPVGDLTSSWTRDFVQSASETQSGILKLATIAQAQARTDDTTALTPKKLADSYKGANQSLATTGFSKEPGGIIRQWGATGAISSGGSGTAIVFPTAFTTAVFGITIGVQAGTAIFSTVESLSSTGFVYSAWNTSAARVAGVGIWWQAVGH